MSFCSNDSPHCTQKYSAKEYFLALFIVIAFILILRMVLYVMYRAFHRAANHGEPTMEGSRGYSAGLRDHDTQGMAINVAQDSTNRDTENLLCVVLAGEDRPRFIAQPAPLSGYRDSNKKVEEPDIKILGLL